MTQVHVNTRQVTGKIPRELNDILRQLQNAFRELKGYSGEVKLLSPVSVSQEDFSSALKIFSTGVGGAFGVSVEESTVHIARGGYRNPQGVWIATDPVAVILSLTRDGALNLYRNTGLALNGPFSPDLVGPLLPPGLGAPSSVITITNNYVVEQGVTLILADASAGPFSVTLPAVQEGRTIAIKKIDATLNIVTVEGDIDGDVDFDLLVEDESIEVVADSSEWWIV